VAPPAVASTRNRRDNPMVGGPGGCEARDREPN